MKRRIFSILLAALLLGLAACAPGEPEPSQSGEVSPPPSESTQPVREPNPFALAWDPGDSLDPLQAGATNQLLAPLVFEGLFALDESFAPQPALCAVFGHDEECLNWTFTLRAGVTFSDGTPLTAVHAADSINAARTSALYGARLAWITRVTASDDTVTITLSSPNGNLPALLDVPVFLPAAPVGEDEPETYPLGTGRYCFDSSAGALCLRASPAWRGTDALPLETILLRETRSADDRISAFDAGLVTLTEGDLTGSNPLGYSGNYETWDYPTATMLYLCFNAKDGPCRDAVLRQAISRGIDRAALSESFLSGHADPTPLPVSPHSALYDESLAGTLDYSLAEAAQLLADGGYVLAEDGTLLSRNRPVTLTLLVNNENTFKTAIAGHLASELSKLGLSVTVVRLGWEEFTAALTRGEFDLCLNQVRMTADFDPWPLLSGTLNYGEFYSAETAGLLELFRAASGSERAPAASALYAQLALDAPIAPLCFQHRSVFTQWGSMSGLSPVQGNPFYGMEHWNLA